MAGTKYITASEIGEYVYCPRAWWLRTNIISKPTPQTIAGTAYHESLFSKINWNPRLKIIALLIMAISGLIILLIIRGLLGL